MSELEHIRLSNSQTLNILVAAGQHKTLFLSYESVVDLDLEINIELANDASLTIYHCQNAASIKLRNDITVQQAKNTTFTMADMVVGATHAQNTITVNLDGEHAHCDIYGLFVGNEHQQLGFDVTVNHNAAHTTSNQDYKGLADDSAKALMISRVVVSEGAQKISSKQSSKNILLSKSANIQTQPELEIYADDVQCAHGATIGELDANALFYLQSRGIALEDAKAMMTYAFVGENIDRILDKSIRSTVQKAVLPKIPNSKQLVGSL